MLVFSNSTRLDHCKFPGFRTPIRDLPLRNFNFVENSADKKSVRPRERPVFLVRPETPRFGSGSIEDYRHV